MNEQFLSALQAENLPVSLDESLGRHTTFRIGGNADFFCVPATVTQLTRILELCRQYQVRTYLLGNGSNTLFSDAGFGGAVICLTGLNSRFSMQAQLDGSTKVLAPAGMMLSALCNTAQKESLAGLEFAFGIPGGQAKFQLFQHGFGLAAAALFGILPLPQVQCHRYASKLPHSAWIARKACAFVTAAAIFARLRTMPGSSRSAASFSSP